MDAEKKLRCQFRKNWSKMKDEISPRWNVIADLALEKNILEFEDYEKIKSLQTENVKIEAILLIVVKLKKCMTFIDILEEKEFGRLCKDVKDTVISIEPIQRDQTYTIDSDMSINEMWRKMEQKFEDARLSQIERDNRMEQELHEIRSTQTESQEQMKRMEKHFELTLAEAKSKYDKLQSAYQFARGEIERLTVLTKQKTSENAEHLSHIETLKKSVEKSEYTPRKELEKKEIELENLRDKLKQETGIIESFKTDIEKLNSEKDQIATQLLETKSELVQMRSKCDRLEAKSQSEYDDIMKKIDSLASSHEAIVAQQSNDAHIGTEPKNTQTTIPNARRSPFRSGNKYLFQNRKYNAHKKK